MPENHKFCSLIFDEMAIGLGVSYDAKNDKIIGLVNNGETTVNEFCDRVLVFMMRGVVKKYKQPLAYYFCSGTTKAIGLKTHIKNIITDLQKTGLKITTTVCDQGSSNVAAVNLLLKETREWFLRENRNFTDGFFEIGKQQIFPLYDPPHPIKGIRNNLLCKNLKYTLKGRQCMAKWDHIVALYKRRPGYSGVNLIPKLTAHHVVPELIPKMRVKHCTQVFSQSVGVAMGYMAELGVLEKESTETADLLIFFDKLFDSVNGSYSQVQNYKIYIEVQ